MIALYEFYGLHAYLPNIKHSFKRTNFRDYRLYWNSYCAYLSPRMVYWFKRVIKGYYL